jgi:hypothetical protein
MRRGGVVLLVLLLAGCGSGGIQGALDWKQPPAVSAHAARGVVRNTTSRSFTLDTHSMRLLDDQGRKVKGRFAVSPARLPANGTASLHVTWKSGKPVRIDYGAGTLALGSS